MNSPVIATVFEKKNEKSETLKKLSPSQIEPQKLRFLVIILAKIPIFVNFYRYFAYLNR